MNKNDKNKNRQSSGDNQSDIITKKGFLISLPGKKKDKASGSSINMSSSHNPEMIFSSGEPARQGHVKGAYFNKERDNRDNRDNKGRQKEQNKRNSDKTGSFRKNDNRKNSFEKNQKAQNTKQNAPSADDAKPSGNMPQSEMLNQQKDAQNKNSGKDRFSRPSKKRGDRNRNGRDGRNDRQSRQDGKNQKTESLENRNERRSNNHNHQGQRASSAEAQSGQIKQQLSSLSADLSVRSMKMSGQQEPSVMSQKALEEKYANMPTLAEQIAEDEARNKKILHNDIIDGEGTEIVGVRFREAGKIYYFDPDSNKIPFGTPVIVETARGLEYGFTAISNRLVPSDGIVLPLKKIQRIATKEDTEKYTANKSLEESAAEIFKEKVAKLGLEMHLVYVEYTFDNSKLLFYFSAESRVDFRELVKDLAGVFRTRIELRQIGVRDKAKTLGGLGNCGRCTCCSSFLGDFAQVSIKMAKDQSLSLNAAKISGACGKLMCCLRYEDKFYEEENKKVPGVGAIVSTVEGAGTVVDRNVLKGIIKVRLDDAAPDAVPAEFKASDVEVRGYRKTEEDKEEIPQELKDAE